MKNIFKRFSVVVTVSFFALLASCSKDEDNSNEYLEQKIITGTIIIPEGIDINMEQWKVDSPIDESNIKDKGFQLNTFSSATSTILIKNGNNVMLMGYKRPQEGTLDITTETTAKALIMCVPLMAGINEVNRFQLIDASVALPEFQILQKEVHNNLKTGHDLFDPKNEPLFIALGMVVNKIATNNKARYANVSAFEPDPVKVTQENKTLTFSNKHIAYTTVVGIYKDGKRLKKIQIDGVDALPTSISELYSAVFGSGTTTLLGDGIVSESYNFESNGDFDVKIRTGRPFKGNNTAEYNEALKANLIHASRLALSTFLPAINGKKAECFATLGEEILGIVNSAQDVDERRAVYIAFKHTLSSTENFYKCVYGEDINISSTYFGSLGKLYSIFSKYEERADYIGAIYGNLFNLTFLATQWAIVKPKVDLCFVVSENTVEKCSDTPHKIEKVSGDNQAGTFGNQLTTPLKVKVVDNLDKPQANVPIYFTVSSGGGKLQDTTILTDANGFAETLWTLGASGEQTVNVSAKKADGTALLNSPISFTATATATPSLYTTVTIGTQIWTTKNLDVSTYRDGTPIPQVTDAKQWAALKTGAWCYYENKAANGTVYGKLYNSYAEEGIHDTDPSTPNKILAPTGYHIPTVAEWNTLITFLGGNQVAGGKMKATTLWTPIPPGSGAVVTTTNSSGFTGLPGGGFSGTPNYSFGTTGYWWCDVEQSKMPQACRLRYNEDTAYYAFVGWGWGVSVRCIKD